MQDLINRLIPKIYALNVVKYVSERFNVPESEIAILYSPKVLGRTLDLVLICNGKWFIVFFKLKPNLPHDVNYALDIVEEVKSALNPEEAIPILAYIGVKPSISLEATRISEKLAILSLAGESYEIIHEFRI